MKCFPCLWQILNFSGQISEFLVDFFGVQKHSPFISWQCKEKLFKLHFSFPFQILSGTRNIYAQLKQKIKNAPHFSRISVFHCQLSPLPYFCHDSFRVAFLWAAGGGKSELGHRHIDSHMYQYKSLCICEKFGTNPISGVSESINLQILYFLGIQVVACIASYILH